MKNIKKTNFAAVILAGGIGKRMQSEKSKVLHKIKDKIKLKRQALRILRTHAIPKTFLSATKHL